MHHFKDCNYECCEWLTASTEHKLFCWPCLLFNLSKGTWNGRPMDIIYKWQASALLFNEGCIMHIVMEVYVVRWQYSGVWMSSICTVLLLWVRRHFRVTWMCIKWPVYWQITFIDHVKKCTLHLTHPTLAYCWNCWSVVIVVESLCAAWYVHYMHMAALAVTEMCKMCTCSLQLLTEGPDRNPTVCHWWYNIYCLFSMCFPVSNPCMKISKKGRKKLLKASVMNCTFH